MWYLKLFLNVPIICNFLLDNVYGTGVLISLVISTVVITRMITTEGFTRKYKFDMIILVFVIIAVAASFGWYLIVALVYSILLASIPILVGLAIFYYTSKDEKKKEIMEWFKS